MWSKEELEELHRTISRRKSVRRYRPVDLEEERLEEIRAKTGELMALDEEVPLAFRIHSAAELKGIITAKAPHFLTVYSDGGDFASGINAAFALQQMDLWLSSQGLGCCWLGMPGPSASEKEVEGLAFQITLAFGTPGETHQRQKVAEFKRKPVEKITDCTGEPHVVEALHLAPSSVNKQPWFLTKWENTVDLYIQQNSAIARKLYGEYSRYDCGIALCHMWLAAEHEDRFEGFPQEEHIPAPVGYRYIRSVALAEK